MEVYCNGIAQIQHAETGVIYTIESDELDWDQIGGDERDMGSELHYEAIVQHPELGLLTWGLWEYLIGLESHKGTDVGHHTVVQNFEFGLRHVMEEDDDWLNADAPDEPFDIFMNSYHQTGDLLADHGGEDGTSLMNRMIFAHHVTALEAYLGDTLVKKTLGDEAVLARMMTDNIDLKDAPVTLSQLTKTPGITKDMVRKSLREVLYHHLKKVDRLYTIAFQFRILPLAGANRGSLFRAIQLRHDCVHRNGFDMDGNELTVFTKAFVQETADKIRDFAKAIEDEIRKADARRWMEEDLADPSGFILP